MTPALDILAEAERHGVRLALTETGTIKASAKAPPPPELLSRLRDHRAAIIDVLSTHSDSPVRMESDSGVDQEERAAIVEFDAGIPREWAEGFARLCEMPRPHGFSPQRWRQLLDDAGKFMDCWASRVAALGWTTEEVFGVHPVAPDARQDAKGLVALIGGHQVVAVSASTITTFTQSKCRLVLRRSQRAYDAQPLWQLQ